MTTQQSPAPPQAPEPPRRNVEPRRDASYFEKVLGYVPADVLAAYMTFQGILTEQADNPVWLHWGMFFALLVLAPIYCVLFPKEPPPMLYATRKYFCGFASALAFAALCFAMGGPFASLAWYRPVYGSLVLILTALILPILEKILLNEQDPPHNNSDSESHQ